jgi:hypothetical protein
MAHGMSTDTKWIVGTGAAIILSVVGTGVALGGLLSVQFAAINARFDDVNARFDDLRADLAAVKADLTAEIAVVRDDVRRMDDRLRAVEIAFGKVDQRLETLERLHLPGPDAGE